MQGIASVVQKTSCGIRFTTRAYVVQGLAFEEDTGALMVLSALRSAESLVSISAAAEFATTLLVIRSEVGEAAKARPAIKPAATQPAKSESTAVEAKGEAETISPTQVVSETAGADVQTGVLAQVVSVLQQTQERIARMESTISGRLDSLEGAVQRHSVMLQQLSAGLHNNHGK
jgi:hypothetical protein